jgi:hypothetical protein
MGGLAHLPPRIIDLEKSVSIEREKKRECRIALMLL